MTNWKQTAARKVRAMTPEEARDALARITAHDHRHGYTIMQPEIRALTGGFNSQAINFHVMRLLGARARNAQNDQAHDPMSCIL